MGERLGYIMLCSSWTKFESFIYILKKKNYLEADTDRRTKHAGKPNQVN